MKGLYWNYFHGQAPVITNSKKKWHKMSYPLCDRYIPYAKAGYIVSQKLGFLINDSVFTGLYWGYFDGRAPVITNPKKKWHETSYPLCDKYIPYALGGGYVVAQDLVHFVADNADKLQMFLNEDVALGTWLAPLKVHR